MSDNKKTVIEIPGIVPVLFTLLFMYLKLTNQIDWSWWWVFSPFWIPISAILIIFVRVLLAVGVIMTLEKLCD